MTVPYFNTKDKFESLAKGSNLAVIVDTSADAYLKLVKQYPKIKWSWTDNKELISDIGLHCKVYPTFFFFLDGKKQLHLTVSGGDAVVLNAKLQVFNTLCTVTPGNAGEPISDAGKYDVMGMADVIGANKVQPGVGDIKKDKEGDERYGKAHQSRRGKGEKTSKSKRGHSRRRPSEQVDKNDRPDARGEARGEGRGEARQISSKTVTAVASKASPKSMIVEKNADIARPRQDKGKNESHKDQRKQRDSSVVQIKLIPRNVELSSAPKELWMALAEDYVQDSSSGEADEE